MIIVYVSLVVLLIGVSFLAWLVYSLQQRIDKLVAGKSGASLEPTLLDYYKSVEKVQGSLIKLQKSYDHVTAMAELASQKVSLVRFNPFGDTGGDQSFSLAVLDAHDSGYVLTSIHGREGTRVYVKPLDFGKSKYPLSDEEQKALSQASKRTISAPKAKE